MRRAAAHGQRPHAQGHEGVVAGGGLGEYPWHPPFNYVPGRPCICMGRPGTYVYLTGKGGVSHCHLFRTGCVPLSHSGNPGVNLIVYLTGVGVAGKQTPHWGLELRNVSGELRNVCFLTGLGEKKDGVPRQV